MPLAVAVAAALRGLEERPFEAGVTAGMGRMVREIDGMRECADGPTGREEWDQTCLCKRIYVTFN